MYSRRKSIKEKQIIIYSVREENRNGVDILMKNNIGRLMMGFWATSERVIMLKLQTKPFNINIISVHATALDCEDELVEKLYQERSNDMSSIYVRS